MLEVYSLNTTVTADSSIPLNNVSFKKGCTATIEGTSSIALNKCGVYEVSVDGSATSSVTVQMYKNGIAQPQAQSTGSSPAFTTLVSVDESNTYCPCSAPTTIQFISTAGTYTNFNVVVTKLI